MIELTLLGSPRITFHSHPVTGLLAKSQALLFYLALQKRGQSRLALAALLWPEKAEPDALTNLRQVLHNLRQQMPALLQVDRTMVALNPATPCQVDVEQFEHSCAAHQPLAVRQAAVAAYTGEFLAGFHVADAQPFEEWQAITRERLHFLAVQTLESLVDHFTAHCDPAGLRYTSQLLALEPWSEKTHRAQMRLLAWSGQRRAALAHYERCCQLLAQELNTDPQAETVALYEQIQRGDFPASKAAAPAIPALPAGAGEALNTAPPRTVAGDGLPQHPNRFVGRRDEVAHLLQFLQDEDCRLITLIGLGGIGKTRLALEIARQIGASFPDGVCFVDLTAVDGAAQVPGAMAVALHLPANNETDLLKAVLAYLAPRTLLLVLDNLEHLPGCAPMIASLLAEAPAVKVLGTARVRLNLRKEWVFDVGGMATPPADRRLQEGWTDREVNAIAQYDAVRLFVERARRVSARFVLAAENAAAVAAICRLCDGIPLAIELAAGWVRSLSCAEIAGEIEHSPAVLATAEEDVPLRQRSVQSVFESTWQRLSPHEQRVLMLLSCFRGGFERHAASVVAGAGPTVLATLVDHALIVRHLSTRYSLHELMRQFLGQKLGADPDLFHLAGATHAHFFAAFLHSYQDLEVGTAAAKVRAIEGEIDNIRTAWHWLMEHLDTPLSVGWLDGMVDVMHKFFDARSQYRAGTEWFTDAVAQIERSPHAQRQDVVLLSGRLMSRLARLHFYLGNFAQTEQLVQQSLAIATRFNDTAEIAFCVMRLGYLAKNACHHADAILHFGQAQALYGVLGDRTGVVWALNGLGLAHAQSGHPLTSRACFTEARELALSLDNLMLRTIILNNLGAISADLGNYVQALSTLHECLQLNQALDDLEGIGYAHWGIAANLLALGQLEDAYQHSLTALESFRTVEYQRGIAYALIRAGEVALHLNRNAEAANFFEQAHALVRQRNLQEIAPFCLLALARFHLSQQQLDVAHTYIEQVLAESRRLEMNAVYTEAQVLAGEIDLARQQWAPAQAYLDAAMLLAYKLELFPLFLAAIARQAQLCWRQGHHELALTLLRFVVSHAAAKADVRRHSRQLLRQLASYEEAADAACEPHLTSMILPEPIHTFVAAANQALPAAQSPAHNDAGASSVV